MMAALVAMLVLLAQAPPAPGGTIRGRVVDREDGRPLARAVVRLAVLGGNVDMRGTITDERGVFVFEGLPPGRYSGFVVARQHGMSSLEGRNPLTIAGNQVVELTVSAPRTRAITVRVVDPFGDPLSNVRVHAVALDTGRTPFAALQYTTDDLGRLRLSDLPPGRYAVCAEPTGMGLSGRGSARTERLLRTCYPSADEKEAEAIRVASADVEGVEIRMRRGRTYTISGTVLDPAGVPVSAGRLMLSKFEANGGSSSSVQLDAGGRFSIRNVPPGGYGLEASIGGVDQPFKMPRPDAAAFVEVRVTDADVDGIVLSLKSTVDVAGRVIAEEAGAALPRSEGSGLMITARLPDEHLPGTGSQQIVLARDDRTFTIEGIFGPRLVHVRNEPRGWYVKSIRYGDREIIDTAVDFKAGADAPALEVVLSSRGASVNGTVIGNDGAPVPRAMVYLLRLSGPRGISVAASERATATGSFTIGPARGGDYAVVALPSTSEVLESASQDRLSRLAAEGERLTLSDLDERSVRVSLIRER
jgi:protocatechuate 3,4-dioxygenase beta subunit